MWPGKFSSRYIVVLPSASVAERPPWRNRLARSAVNRKVGGSSPPGGALSFSHLMEKREKGEREREREREGERE